MKRNKALFVIYFSLFFGSACSKIEGVGYSDSPAQSTYKEQYWRVILTNVIGPNGGIPVAYDPNFYPTLVGIGSIPIFTQSSAEYPNTGISTGVKFIKTSETTYDAYFCFYTFTNTLIAGPYQTTANTVYQEYMCHFTVGQNPLSCDPATVDVLHETPGLIMKMTEPNTNVLAKNGTLEIIYDDIVNPLVNNAIAMTLVPDKTNVLALDSFNPESHCSFASAQ